MELFCITRQGFSIHYARVPMHALTKLGCVSETLAWFGRACSLFSVTTGCISRYIHLSVFYILTILHISAKFRILPYKGYIHAMCNWVEQDQQPLVLDESLLKPLRILLLKIKNGFLFKEFPLSVNEFTRKTNHRCPAFEILYFPLSSVVIVRNHSP